MAEEILVLKDVVKIYDGRPVLDGVSFTVREGEYVSVCGESTSGKTTLYKVIVGLVPMDSGQVILFGQDMARLSERDKVKLLKNLGMQFQSGALFDSMNVRDNIMFVLGEKTNMTRKDKEGIITRLLKGVNLFSAREKFPFELSGGMKKRVAVARTLATTPRLALFDEPAAGLDPVTSVRIVNLIKNLTAEYRMTIMVATTDVHLALKFSERFLLLKDGRIHADAPWSELQTSGDEYTKKFLSRALAS